ncbi:MAG TPA: AMP-binding protein [Sporichthya sp.]|nr:AMP-binding protein [Sporichthya sp.]
MSELLARKADVVRAIGRGRQLARRQRNATRDEFDVLRGQRLRRLVAHAAANTPYYAKVLSGVDVDSPGLLQRLPVLDKETLVGHLPDLLSDSRLRTLDLEARLNDLAGDELLLGEYRLLASGGTSGKRGIYVYDRAAWREVMSGLACGADWLGFGPHIPRQRLATIWAAGPAHMTARLAASFRTPAFRRLQLTALAPIPELVEQLNRFQPDWLSAYPTIAALLADEQLSDRLRIRPRVVMVTSEQCTAAMRSRIEAAWGTAPYDAYASTECGGMAIECHEHAGLHLMEEQVILEVVDEDGAPVPDGEPGARVLVTNLFNFAQPIIRFALTDIVSIDPKPCPCGRASRRITAVEGRSDDIMRLPGQEGRDVPVHPNHFAEAIESVGAVRAYQVVQIENGVDIAVSASADVAGEVTRRVEASLATLGVTDTSINVRMVPTIERPASASSKFKLVSARA